MLSDLRFAFRALCKTPGFTAAAILILALGIGANTSVFSVVEAVLLRPLPFPASKDLYLLKSAVGNQIGLFNVAEYCAYRDQTRAFKPVVAATAFNTSWVDQGEAQLVQGLRLSADTYEMLGLRPVIGRLLRAADDRPDAPKVIVLSEPMWQRVYGGRSDVIGRSVVVDGEARTIVGVVPTDFILPVNAYHADVAVPLQADANPARHQASSLHYLRVFARLAPGITVTQALEDSRKILIELRRQYPTDFIGAETNELVPLADEIVGATRPVLLTLLGVVASLLLLASANLAGLLLVRGLGRQRELAIRSALGCSRGQLIRLVFAECLVLSLAGAIAGLLFAQWNLGALLSLMPADLPRAHEVRFNGTLLGFTLLVSLVAGLLPGLAPVWLCSRMDLRDAVSMGGRGNTVGGAQMRLRHVLAAIQVALALALLSCTGLFLRSFWAIDSHPPGADPAHIITARLSLPKAGYPDVDALVRYSEALRPRLEALPGIQHVGTTSLLPLASGLATAEFALEGQPTTGQTNLPSANYRLVTPGFFEAMGIPLREGRRIESTDDAKHPLVVIVSATLADTYFPNHRVLGQRLQINDAPDGYRTFEIIGVVADVKQSKMEDGPSADVYVPFRQMTPAAVPWVRLRNYWVLRSTVAPQALEAALRREIRAVDPGVPVASVQTMEQVVDSSLAVRRFTLIIIGFLAGAALLLTTAGIYATIAYGVAQRTREIGVRLALGATARQIFRLIVGEGLALAAAGAVLGLAAAFALSQLIASQLYEVSPRDPIAMTSSAVLLLLISAIACSLPARRAARTDPLEAMRTE